MTRINLKGISALDITGASAASVANGVASLTIAGSGDATSIQGVPVDPTPPSHNGELLIYDSMSSSYVPGDPLVQGIQAEGTAANTVNPVLIAGEDGSGDLKNLVLDASGRPTVNVNGTVPVSGTVAVTSAGLTNLDVALSTRTKPSDQQHTIIDSGTVTAVTAITNALPAGTNSIGQVTANAGTNLNTSALSLDASTKETHGTVAAGTAASKSELVGVIANSVAPTPTNGQQIAAQSDLSGALRVNPMGNAGSFQVKTATVTSSGLATQTLLTVSAGKKWLLRAARVTYTANGTAGTRTVSLVFQDGSGNGFIVAPSGVSQTASTTNFFDFGSGIPQATAKVGSEITVPVPNEISLGPGFQIAFNVPGSASGDSVAIVANIVEYFD